MAYVAVQDLWLPRPQRTLATVVGLIDATGEKFAYLGRVFFPARTGTKDIRKVHFLFGTVTKAGGSALTVSLQDVDLTAGPPHRPDGTQDQTVAIANADAGFASNTWYTTGNLSADRTVTFGDYVAVVVEYDGSGRLSSDAVNFSGLSAQATAAGIPAPGPVLFTSSWATVNARNGVVLEFSDGTFGCLDDAGFASATSNTGNINTGTTPDEVALKFTPTFDCKIDGGYMEIDPENAGASNFDVVLYEGTTPLQTVSVDAQTLGQAVSHLAIISIPEQELAAGTAYYLAYKPTTASSSNVAYFDVADANHLSVLGGGTAWHYATRVDGGAWTATTTRRPNFGIRISAIDDGTGSGGGGASKGKLTGLLG
jgi:hypothetical protein